MATKSEIAAELAKLPWYGKAGVFTLWWLVVFAALALVLAPPLWFAVGVWAAKVGLALAWVGACVLTTLLWSLVT